MIRLPLLLLLLLIGFGLNAQVRDSAATIGTKHQQDSIAALWSKPINIGSMLGSQQHDYAPIINKKGSVLYFTRKKDTTTSVYKDLDTLKMYSASFYHTSGGSGGDTYEINDEEVPKHIYDRYHKYWENINRCTPCVMRNYDLNDVLLKEGIRYTDCIAGWFKHYYPDGKTVRLSSQYKENPGEWTDENVHDYCSVKHGTWTYYDKSGERLYQEVWEDDKFIKQVPEQDSMEVWEVDFLLDEQLISTDVISRKDIVRLTFLPKYKNSSRDRELSITLKFSASRHKPIHETYSVENFKNADVKAMLKQLKGTKLKDINCYLIAKVGDITVDLLYFRLKR